MRSLADALAKLTDFGGLDDGQSVEIRATALPLPDGRLSGLVGVIGPARTNDSRWVISMPPSKGFTATTTRGERRTYDIEKLNNAVSDENGNVQLATGEFIHRVELIPSAIRSDFSDRDHAIVRML